VTVAGVSSVAMRQAWRRDPRLRTVVAGAERLAVADGRVRPGAGEAVNYVLRRDAGLMEDAASGYLARTRFAT
jgi:hypothetical protein